MNCSQNTHQNMHPNSSNTPGADVPGVFIYRITVTSEKAKKVLILPVNSTNQDFGGVRAI